MILVKLNLRLQKSYWGVGGTFFLVGEERQFSLLQNISVITYKWVYFIY